MNNKAMPTEIPLEPVCSMCGEKPAYWIVDPFKEEVYGEVEYDWWCRSCWENRKDDI